MRHVGPKQEIPQLPDTVLSLLLTAGSAQAFDYPSGSDVIRLTAGSTAAGASVLFFNPSSTAATQPSTGGTVSTAASGLNIAIPLGEARMYFRQRGSTGFSLVCGSSMSVSVEFWSRAGTTG